MGIPSPFSSRVISSLLSPGAGELGLTPRLFLDIDSGKIHFCVLAWWPEELRGQLGDLSGGCPGSPAQEQLGLCL